ncbi:hypothetical protein IMZ48_01985 [Candidatus Bathyarchaeota archaeon]|nr:hypothetical protein [Candidatus Bathyarchaeota archaeon]
MTFAAAIPNCSDFVIKKEDHTIGNLVSEHAKMHRNVLMAGYKSMSPVPRRTHRSVEANTGHSDSPQRRGDLRPHPDRRQHHPQGRLHRRLPEAPS